MPTETLINELLYFVLNNMFVDGPRFVEEEEGEVTGGAGDRIILQCQVDSNPAAQYRWVKNGDVFEVR